MKDHECKIFQLLFLYDFSRGVNDSVTAAVFHLIKSSVDLQTLPRIPGNHRVEDFEK